MRLIGVDVGGTFTDLVYADTEAGQTGVHKISTTPDDPSRGVVAGLTALCDKYGIPRDTIDTVFHGTTIATNAILEHDGAVTGMITTGGYRDILHIGRHQRPQHYSIMQDIPWQDRPLVKRRHRKTVKERLVPPRGEVLEPLDEQGVRDAVRELKEAGVQAIAICFLFSYLDPAHEARAMEIVREDYPECFATTSSSVSPQFREFERFTTTAMNAFVGPKVRNYVTKLEADIEQSGFKADLRIMASNGGVATPAMVAERPVLTLLSGPAAGVIGGDWAGGLSGKRNLITFDVGGTSADIGIVTDGGFGEATRARHLDRRLSRAGADDRRAHDRRRRRLDRLRRPGRRLQGRAALGRRRAGPGRLWPGRQRADGDRRQRRAGPARPQELPGRRHVARRGRGPPRDRRAGRASSACPSAKRPRAWSP